MQWQRRHCPLATSALCESNSWSTPPVVLSFWPRSQRCRYTNRGVELGTERHNRMLPATLGHFSPKNFRRLSSLLEKVFKCFHDEAPRVALPCTLDSQINGRGVFNGFERE